MTDPQQTRVYQMENEFLGWSYWSRSTREQLDTFTARVCKYYKVHPPRLVVTSKGCNGHYGDYGQDTIYLYRGRGENVAVLLHELAHYLVDEFYGESVQDHGPEFCAIYMHLLDKYEFLPHQEFRRLAGKYRVQIGRRYRPKAFR